MTNVLVTHADEPLGRRIVKTLYFDGRIGSILAVGDGPPPRAFDRFLAGSPARVVYARLDLAKHRPVAELFHSSRFRAAAIDSVVHVPQHRTAPSTKAALFSGLHPRTAEARLVLHHSLDSRSVRNFVAIGSAYVYRLSPGNANRLQESSELDLDPKVSPELRAWIDCDMIFHAEVGNEQLRVVLLRVPTVVASGGYVYLNPSLAGRSGPRVRPLGFDPMCALISDKDVARAVQSALHSESAGIFNIAGAATTPLSVLGRWTRRPTLPLPGPLLRLASVAAGALGSESVRAALSGPYLHYGFTLDTRRAERELAFRPSYRIGRSRAGDGRLRLETSPA